MRIIIKEAKTIYLAMSSTKVENVPQTPQEWKALEQTYERALAECDNPDEIREVIDMISSLDFPISLLMDSLHKPIQLRREPEELRMFAGCLRIYYSDEEDDVKLANQLEVEAKQLEE